MTLAEQIELVCLMEATARKPGNVHPGARFSDLCYGDFVRAAHAIAEPLAVPASIPLGQRIYDAVKAAREATGTNVNLGIVFLLAPLAAVPLDISLEQGLPKILDRTTVIDAEQVYAAIQIAQPGGLGEVADQDVRDPPTVTLREAMELARDRDLIAQQYVTNFHLVFKARSKAVELFAMCRDWETAVVSLQLWLMSKWPDTLIARKCGLELAQEASTRAAAIIGAGPIGGSLDPQKIEQFDGWLRADGHRRNPGTTADLIAAALFMAVRDKLITPPTLDEIRYHAIEHG